MNVIDKPGVLVVTHPRSGTHLTMDLLRRNFPALRSEKRRLEPLDSLYVPLDIIMIEGESGLTRVKQLLQRHKYPILKSHWLEPGYLNLNGTAADVRQWIESSVKPIYIIRQPRKVMASYLLFNRTHKEIPNLQIWFDEAVGYWCCLLYTSPSPRDQRGSRMPSSA